MAQPNQSPPTDGAPVTTVRLQNIAQSYGQSAALMAAVEVGVFTAISKGAGTYEEVAAALDIHPTNAERLMVMLCAAGLLEKTQGRHQNAPDVERFLVEGKPGYMGPWITFTKPQWNEWGRLERAHPHQEPEGDGRDRDIHGRRRAALPQCDLLDRHGRRPPLRAPGRPRGPQAHHGHRRRLRRLLHRRCEGACRHPRRGAGPARRVRGRRASSSPRTASPTASRLNPATSRAIRSRPTATSPSWLPTCRCTAAR